MIKNKICLSLCDLTGVASEPWGETHDIIKADIQSGQNIISIELKELLQGRNPEGVDVIIAQPPCTHFASSGARWFEKKGEQAILDGLAVVDACLRYVWVCKPRVFVMEQPIGRLPRWVGDPVIRVHPWEFAHYADDPEDNAYTKKTCLYGNFAIPEKKPWLGEVDTKRIHHCPPSKERANIRSAAPQGLWRAIYEANKDTERTP